MIQRSLMFKLIAAFLVVSLVAVFLLALFGLITTQTEFNRFVSQEAENNFYTFVSEYYADNGNLNEIDQALRESMPRPGDGETFQIRLFPMLLTDTQGNVLIGQDGFIPGDVIEPTLMSRGKRVLVNGDVVAIAIPRQAPFPRNRAQEEYIQRTFAALIAAGVGAALVAVFLGVWWARRITQPLQELTAAAQNMARGDLGQSVRVTSQDEVGELALAFNRMSADLAHADRTRRQMTADIAHELRNPLTVIGGYLDAMRLGDLQPTPERLAAVYDEIEHLEHMVDDLRTLSLADAGALTLMRQRVPVGELLRKVAKRFEPQAQKQDIELTFNAPVGLDAEVDEARMVQVLDNLVGNAFKHTPQGGSVQLTANRQDRAVELCVADTGMGISAEELPRIFERFYRVDKARTGNDGSSGLGLAIAKALVEAHGGTIRAESEPGQGTTIIIYLPTEKTSADVAGAEYGSSGMQVVGAV